MASGRKSTFVLVHGAWHGGWCWKKVVPALRAAGHEVFTPSLTGLGERAHLASAAVDLDTHITDIASLIETEELTGVVLVGHSYAGMVITGVADRAGPRLRRLIYLDAFVPESGKCQLDYLHADRRDGVMQQGRATGYVDPLPLKLFGVTDPQDVAWASRHLTRQPYATMSQPVLLQGDGGAGLPRTYIYCSNPPTGSFDQFAVRLRNDPNWKFHELNTGHDCMITDPGALIRVLLDNV